MFSDDSLDPDDRTVENTESERDALDHAVLSTIGLKDELGNLKQAISHLVAMRERDAGQNTEVMVTRPSETEVINLEGVSKVARVQH